MADVLGFVQENALPLAIGGAVLGVGAGVATAAALGSASKSKTRRSRGRSRDRKFKSKQKHEQRYKRKRKYKVYKRKGYVNPNGRKKSSKARRGSKKVYYARKTGQPYILLASGKAKFIKGKRRKR